MQIVLDILVALYELFLDAGIYVLFGFTVAGLLNWLFPPSVFLKYLNTGRFRSIVNAALIGVPLPLCSCSVIPTALTIGKRGASRGATASFLISTPESGVDSIAVTYGLLDGIMAVFRPFAAFVSAIVTGLMVELWGGTPTPEQEQAATEAAEHSCCDDDDCGAPPPPTRDDDCGHDHDHAHDLTTLDEAERGTWWDRSFGFAFGTLFNETSHWFLLGLIMSGIVAGLISEDFVQSYLGAGLLPKVMMVFVGVPIYVCASASTPLAAGLILLGMSPGTALVLLMAGPATNMATITVFAKFFGWRFASVYVASIAVTSIALGFALDMVYTGLGVDAQSTVGQASMLFPFWMQVLGAVVFLGLLLRSVWTTPAPPEFRRVRDGIAAVTGLRLTREALLLTLIFSGLLGYGSTAFSTVPPEAVGYTRTLGAMDTTPRQPGLHAHLPWPLADVETVRPHEVRRLEIGFRSTTAAPADPSDRASNPALPGNDNREPREAIVLTGDENLIDITATAHYRVTDPYRFAVRMADDARERLLRNLVRTELVARVARESIDGVYTRTRAAIEADVLATVNAALLSYDVGTEVTGVHLIDVHAPREVHNAFRDVASAMEDRHRYVNEALTYREENVRRSAAAAHQAVSRAQAEQQMTVQGAEGEALAFKAQHEARTTAPTHYEDRLYLELLERQLPGLPKIVRPSDPATRLDLWRLPGPEEPGRGTARSTADIDPTDPTSINRYVQERRKELLR